MEALVLEVTIEEVVVMVLIIGVVVVEIVVVGVTMVVEVIMTDEAPMKVTHRFPHLPLGITTLLHLLMEVCLLMGQIPSPLRMDQILILHHMVLPQILMVLAKEEEEDRLQIIILIIKEEVMVLLLKQPLLKLNNAMRIVVTLVTIRGFIYQTCHQM